MKVCDDSPFTSGLRPDARHVLGILVILTWFFSSSARAQPVPPPPFGQGTHGFRALLKQMGMKPLTSKEEFQREALANPDRILIIMLGKGDFLRTDLRGGMRTFLGQGGAVLVATDRELELRPFRLAVTGDFVKCDSDSPYAYRDSADCPIVESISTGGRIPIFDGLSKVATNRPSYLYLEERSRLTVLARFPKECRVADPEFPVLGLGNLNFAAAGQVGKGRLLVLGDHSVFINDMILQPDNDNFDFAFQAVSWLSDGKRDRVLFVEDGAIVSNFNVKLKEPPIPPLPSDGEVIRAVNKTLAGLDRENYYNRQLLRLVSPKAGPENQPDLYIGHLRLVQWLVVAVTLGVALLGGMRLLRSRHRIDASVPLLETELNRTTAASVVAQRRQTMVRDGNFWEAAHGLVCEFFRSQTSGLTPPARLGDLGTPLLTSATWRQRRELKNLWTLATATAPRRVSQAEFIRLADQVKVLRAALAAGTVRWQWQEKA